MRKFVAVMVAVQWALSVTAYGMGKFGDGIAAPVDLAFLGLITLSAAVFILALDR